MAAGWKGGEWWVGTSSHQETLSLKAREVLNPSCTPNFINLGQYKFRVFRYQPVGVLGLI